MKKLLNKILPEFLIQILIKQKYKKFNIQIHTTNIQEDHIVRIKCTNNKKYKFLKVLFKKSFGGLIKIKPYTLYFHPIAIIKIPQNIDQYLKHIGAKSRNMIKKAQKQGIECDVFSWNDKLNDIYKINTSSFIRQGREMDISYKEYPKNIEYPKENDFKIVHIGAFHNTILIGYVELYLYGNFAMTNRILGHNEYLRYGIMNLLIKHCVEYAIENNISFINYLTMLNRKNNSLSAFKYRVGFREYSLLEL